VALCSKKYKKKIEKIGKLFLPILACDPLLTPQVGIEVLFKIFKNLAVD
jgi:hypothetical protein